MGLKSVFEKRNGRNPIARRRNVVPFGFQGRDNDLTHVLFIFNHQNMGHRSACSPSLRVWRDLELSTWGSFPMVRAKSAGRMPALPEKTLFKPTIISA
jgi:hypothetical protein